MYIFPVQFPQVSNREDLLLTIALYDDDTGNPIDMSGITLAIPGANFTGANWTVIDGGIVTNSTTSLTIPNYPLGNNAPSLLSLTVGISLGILTGDPITIQDTHGNKMVGYVLSYSAATGALTVQIGMTFEFEIRHIPRSRHGGFSNGYSSLGDIGVYDNNVGPILSAQLGNGITIVDIGYLEILIPMMMFSKLHSKTYQAAMIISDSVNTRQLFIGELPVQSGGVRNVIPPPNAPAPPGSGQTPFNPSPFVPTVL